MSSFHEMQYVYEVFRHQSFSKAAEAMYISQSSLSLMVKKAEKRIGSPIFDRSTLPITLTEAGKAYIRAVMQIMSIEQDFQNEIGHIQQVVTGSLSLGGTTLFTSYVLSPLISAFSMQYPGIDLQLHEAHTEALQQELLAGTLDFAVDNGEYDPNLFERHVYLEEEMLLAVPSRSPANAHAAACKIPEEELRRGSVPQKLPPVPLSYFCNEPFLLLREGNDTRARSDRLFALAGFYPNVRLMTDHQIVCYNLAAYGMGSTFVSQSLVCREVYGDRLCYYRLAPEVSRRAVSLFSKKKRGMTPPMRAFAALLPTPKAP